jgi:hypothetical protein
MGRATFGSSRDWTGGESSLQCSLRVSDWDRMSDAAASAEFYTVSINNHYYIRFEYIA